MSKALAKLKARAEVYERLASRAAGRSDWAAFAESRAVADAYRKAAKIVAKERQAA